MTVYADVLFIVNLIIDYLLLLSVGGIIHIRPPFWRLLLGAVFGALCSFVILLPPLNILLNLLIKAAVSAGMCIITYPIKNLRSFFRCFAWLFGITFAFCGAVTLVAQYFSQRAVSVNNMSVYADLSPLVLIISIAAAYIAIKLIGKIGGRLRPQNRYYEIEIVNGSKSIKCTALHDTGCDLHDLFSGNPVIIVEKSLAMSLIPQSVVNLPANSSAAAVIGNKVRLIPYSAIGGKGMMQAFTPDRASISQNGRTCELNEVTVAVSNEPLCGEYRALIGDETANMLAN